MANQSPGGTTPEKASLGSVNLTLFVVSVLGLFLELLLIRWVGTEIRIFAYLQNTVLVVCFMGLGMGSLTSRRPSQPGAFLRPLAVLVLLLAWPRSRFILGQITEHLTVLSDFLIWSQGISSSPIQTCTSVITGLGLTLVLMLLIWETFVPLGRMVGRLMDEHPNTILAYSVNVAGGLLGIWLFVGLSAWGQLPWVWFAVLAGLALPLLVMAGRGRARWLDLALLPTVVALAWLGGREPGAIEVRWSPYQKLVLKDGDLSQLGVTGIGKYVINVNNTGYQAMIDLSERHLASDPVRYDPAMRGLSQYDLPFLFHKQPETALIVGAGSGNDAAGALRNGVKQVTAVEIDPEIIAMGRRYHPERPYDSPRVAVINDDARAYFATSKRKFDVISFGLLDSHTTTAMTNARLDHYVYTVESLRLARSLLADGGVMVLSFEAQKPFIADRMAGALRQVFGTDPLCFRVPLGPYGWGGVMFVAGDPAAIRACLAANPRLADQVARWQKQSPVVLTGTTRVTTDDWPYVYLKAPGIPLLYSLLAGLLLVLMALGARRLGIGVGGIATDWGRADWHFFFLGAAFLLLEVQNISKASVVLGNTWVVNAVIISGILAMVLLANLVVWLRPRLASGPVYAILVLLCLVLASFDIARLGGLPALPRALLIGGLTSLPMLFSGVIFARSFTQTPHKDRALGANLFGALAGGLIQSATFLIGVRALLLIVGALYLAAFLTRPRPRPLDGPAPLRRTSRSRTTASAETDSVTLT